jgi:hypothetical protein
MVAGQSGTDHGTRARPNGDHLSSVAYTSLTRSRANAVLRSHASARRKTHPAPFLGRFSPLLGCVPSDAADAG